MHNPITHASLFSGIGGCEIAAAMLGFKNVFHCEINPFGRQVLEYWFPDSVSYEDITKTDFKEWRGKIDVLTGGFPCQPFSYAGKRGGREDERYLWPEMLRAIDEIRPTWVVGENVAGLATMVEGWVLSEMGGGSALFEEDKPFHDWLLEQTFTIEKIAKELEGLGYSVQPVLIPAAAVGAPHRRDRIFILAHRDGDNIDRRVPEREVSRKEKPESVRYGSRLQHGKGLDFQWTSTDTAGRGSTSLNPSRRVEEKRSDNEFSEERRFQTERVNGLPAFQRAFANAKDLLGNGCGIGLGGESAREPASELGNGRGENVISDSDCGRGGEVQIKIHTGVADGDFAVGDGCFRSSSYSNGQGREESQLAGRGENQTEEGTGIHDRVERLGSDGMPSDAKSEQHGKPEPRKQENSRRKQVASGRSRCKSLAGLLPENRWRDFPTVSPVHRGNDGLPISLDDLTIPATRWRTESLKAYGNAIVPQVMYRIFQAIEEASR